jgi:hypothetical protein
MGLWFYDFGPAGIHLNKNHQRAEQFGSSGYWDRPAYMATIAALRGIFAQRSERPYRPASDVLFVYDTRVAYFMKSIADDPDPVSRSAIDWMTLAAYRAGFSFDTVHLQDLERINPSRYKVVFFANTFVIGDDARRLIDERLKRDGRHLVWIYAPGYSNGVENSAGLASSVCELELLETEPVGNGNAAAREMSGGPTPGLSVELDGRAWLLRLDGRCEPLFEVAGGADQILGRYTANAKPGAARALRSGWTSWFFGIPPSDLGGGPQAEGTGDTARAAGAPAPAAALLRKIGEAAGAHLYCPDGDVVYAGEGLVVFHTGGGGPKTVALPNGSRVEIAFPDMPSTAIIDTDSGVVLYRSDTIQV